MSQISDFNCTQITDRLFVGGGIVGADEIATLAAQGVTHLLSAAAELDDGPLAKPAGLASFRLAWADDGKRKPELDFRAAYLWVLEQEAMLGATGKQIGLYIHCASGIHRGPLLATYLLAAFSGDSAITIYDRIKALRPVVAAFDVVNYERSCIDAIALLRPFRIVPAALATEAEDTAKDTSADVSSTPAPTTGDVADAQPAETVAPAATAAATATKPTAAAVATATVADAAAK